VGHPSSDSKGEEYLRRLILGDSEPIKKVRDAILKAACHNQHVLITGETGTGKSLVANAIHFNSTRGTRMPMVVSYFDDRLKTPEVFFREAGGNTLIIDNVHRLDTERQGRMSFFIDQLGPSNSNSHDVRIIAITADDLAGRVGAREFNASLFHRLKGVSILTPSLCDIREDIRIIATHFLSNQFEASQIPPKDFTRPAWAMLKAYAWPGNVMELNNTIRTAAENAGRSACIEAKHLPDLIQDAYESSTERQNQKVMRGVEELKAMGKLILERPQGDGPITKKHKVDMRIAVAALLKYIQTTDTKDCNERALLSRLGVPDDAAILSPYDEKLRARFREEYNFLYGRSPDFGQHKSKPVIATKKNIPESQPWKGFTRPKRWEDMYCRVDNTNKVPDKLYASICFYREKESRPGAVYVASRQCQKIDLKLFGHFIVRAAEDNTDKLSIRASEIWDGHKPESIRKAVKRFNGRISKLNLPDGLLSLETNGKVSFNCRIKVNPCEKISSSTVEKDEREYDGPDDD
jgi:hypothetical protein